ncbi:MAG: glycoside hydrolase family 2 TIM barrel-domain containing protein [Armatimonadota bacterium]|nr:glycoside hydrolase family 2 TIM barrel-domain containing protein [Armatimonadota bacterium]
MLILLLILLALCAVSANAQQSPNGWCKVGGFRCVDLKPLKNDAAYNLYEIGYFAYAGFDMNIWKRHGVPFLYQPDAGNIRVAGRDWTPSVRQAVSSAPAGGVARADRQQPGNGAIDYANDGSDTSYWYAGENSPSGRLWIDFGRPRRVDSVRFLGWKEPRHAPKDYSIGLIFSNGDRREIAHVADENRMGKWISFPVEKTIATGVYLDVRTTIDGAHGPVIYELQAHGEPIEGEKWPSEVTIPLGGARAEEVFCLGHVGDGFDTSPDVETPVGEYVVLYKNGARESIPLIAGRNVADCRYGRQFVPDAEFAFGFRDVAEDQELHYHLGEDLPVRPRKQLLMFGYRLKHPREPIESLTFCCVYPKAALVLAGLTLRQSGPRLNALAYNGKVVKPYPSGAPKAGPSPVASMLDKKRILSLDGRWRYSTDPANRGIRQAFFAEDYDASSWKTMPVPSQWYVQGLDYHGVVWFRREFDVPAGFPGSVLELHFRGVDYDARVWVNGKYAGRHTGAFSAFKLDGTALIRKGERNIIVVRVDSPVDPGYAPEKTIIKGNSQDDIAMPYNEEGCTGGIFRPVTLTGRGDVGIENVWTTSAVSKDLKRANVAVRFELNPAVEAGGKALAVCSLLPPCVKGDRALASSWAPAAAKEVELSGRTAVEIHLELDDPALWHPWEQGEPNLYTLKVEVRRGEEILDTHFSRVGVREIGFDESRHCVYVNHRRVFIKGMLNDDIHWMSMMDRTGYRQRIQLQKDANLNLVRMVGHQSSPDMYELCDEMGMMIWQEMPLQWGYSDSQPVRDDVLSIVRDTVIQTRGHASVIGWSAWNEGGQAKFSDRITSVIRDLDGTRPMTRACGGGDFDIHIYPNITPPQMSRRSFFWTGLKLGFVSEVGAYGLSTVDEMEEMAGGIPLKFGFADYFWETWTSYRYSDGPVFWDCPSNGWSTARVRDYILDKIEPSERWLRQFMKFMFENMRAQRFDPTTAAIHCRFDDPMPTAFLGIVNFNGRPRKAYYSVQKACRQVLPILFFDFRGAEDVRVINDYWDRGWTDCVLKCRITDRGGKIVVEISRRFDLPPDSTVEVFKGAELGDIFHIPGGFLAELALKDASGKVISKNHYDLTADEIEAFVTSVYPVPPVGPIDSVVLRTADAARKPAPTPDLKGDGTYSETLLRLGGEGGGSKAEFQVDLPRDSTYLIRVACDSGRALRQYTCLVDGKPAKLENCPYTDMELGMTRQPYSAHNLSWRPGWTASLTQGRHVLKIEWTGGAPAAPIIIDAVCLQSCADPNTRGYKKSPL